MNTSKYSATERKNIKRGQRTTAYKLLQEKSAEQRKALEARLRDRNTAITRLSKFLTEKGFDQPTIDALAREAKVMP